MKLMYFRYLFSFESMIAIVISIAAVGWMDLTDPDFFWHLKNGQLILEKRALFDTDLYSHTAYGNYSLITGWAFDVMVAWLWNTFGPAGIRVMSAIFIFITWLGIYNCVKLYIARNQTAALFALFSIVLLAPLLAARPNLFTHAAFAWVLFILLAYCQSKKLTTLLYLLPLFLLWPFFHFGFASGLGLIGLFIVTAYLDKWMPRSTLQPYNAMIGIWPLTILIAAVIMATINNYGYHIYSELLTMTQRASGSPVSEWQSPSFKDPWQKILLVSIFLYIVALFMDKAKNSWLYLVVPGVLLWLMLTSQRNQGFWAIFLPVLLAMMIAPQLKSSDTSTASSLLSTKGRQPRFTYYLNAFIILLTALVVTTKSPETANKHLKRAGALLPVEATDYLLANVPDGKLYNVYGSGGYLIWRTFPRFPVFADGRYAPYDDQVIDDSIHIQSALRGTLDLLKQYDVEVVLAEHETALFGRMLTSPEHRLVFLNETHSIFVKNTDKYASLPSVSSTIQEL